MSEDDFKAKYQIGARMIIPIALSGKPDTVADVEIVAHNHDNLADNYGKATLTFFCKDLPNILLCLIPLDHNFVTAAQAFEPEICTGAQYAPPLFPAGVGLFHH